MKRYPGAAALILFIFSLVSTSLLSASSNEPVPGRRPRLAPDPMAYYFADNLDTDNWRSLFGLAFWASEKPEWQADADLFETRISSFIKEAAVMDERERAEAVLEFIHDEFLTRYRLKQSSLPLLLDGGSFNCLSSAVLYTIIATAAGLDVSGVNTVDHAFCSVSINGEQIDVETTNRYGVDPGKKKEFKDDFGKVTGFSYVPPANYRDRTSIDRLHLFALILQNRIADLEEDGRFAEAVGPAADRWILLGGGDGAAFEDLITRMLNYGTKLSRSGREADALEWARTAAAVYGQHPKWNDFIDGTVNNLLVKLVRSGRLEDARSSYNAYRPRLSSTAAAELDYMITDSVLIAALDAVKAGGSDEDFTAALSRAEQSGVLPAERLYEIELNWRLYRISTVAKTEGWLAAYTAVEAAVSELGEDPQLLKAGRVYLSNHKAEIYNTAADAFNKGNYQQALALAESAAADYPDEALFRNLLRSIEKAVSSGQ